MAYLDEFTILTSNYKLSIPLNTCIILIRPLLSIIAVCNLIVRMKYMLVSFTHFFLLISSAYPYAMFL